MRFTRQQHIRKSVEFNFLRTAGHRFECAFFSLKIVSLPERDPPVRRLGLVSSRRIGNAVTRNRAKRLMRESFRLHQDLLPLSCDLVMIARRGITGASQADIHFHFQRMAMTLPARCK